MQLAILKDFPCRRYLKTDTACLLSLEISLETNSRYILYRGHCYWRPKWPHPNDSWIWKWQNFHLNICSIFHFILPLISIFTAAEGQAKIRPRTHTREYVRFFNILIVITYSISGYSLLVLFFLVWCFFAKNALRSCVYLSTNREVRILLPKPTVLIYDWAVWVYKAPQTLFFFVF